MAAQSIHGHWPETSVPTPDPESLGSSSLWMGILAAFLMNQILEDFTIFPA